jgi:HEPN domain-containing protein
MTEKIFQHLLEDLDTIKRLIEERDYERASVIAHEMAQFLDKFAETLKHFEIIERAERKRS